MKILMYYFYGECHAKVILIIFIVIVNAQIRLCIPKVGSCTRFQHHPAQWFVVHKMAAIMSSGARVAQEPQKSLLSRMTSLTAHAQSWGLNIEDYVIYLELSYS